MEWTTPRRPDRQPRSLAASLVPLLLLCGCTTRQRLAEAEAQIDELRSVNSSHVASLASAEGLVRELRERVQTAESETARSRSEASALRAELDPLREKAARLEAEKVELGARLERSDRARERVQGYLEEVKSQAASMVNELADLRQQVGDFEERTKSLEVTHASLRKEFSRVNQDLEKAQSELVKKRAVIAALAATSGGEDVSGAFSDKLEQLEAEKKALLARCEDLARRLGDGREARAAAPGPQAVDPSGYDLSRLLGERSQRMLRGEVAWNGIDGVVLAAFAGALVATIWVLWLPFQWRKGWRLRRTAASLRRRVAELERAGAQPGEGALRARGDWFPASGSGFVRRRVKFSPVISPQSAARSSGGEESDVASEGPEAEDAELEEVTVNLGRGPSWERSTEPPEEAGYPRGYDGAGEVPDADDELSSTQVITPAGGDLEKDGGVPGGTASRGDRARQGDRELMAELRDLIGQKVDELIR